MSTNYYFTPDVDNKLSVYGTLHIGKSSAGWAFNFRGYDVQGLTRVNVAPGLSINIEVPSLVVKDYGMMLALLNSGGELTDEYGITLAVNDFHNKIMSKMDGRKQSRATGEGWTDEDGHTFANYEFC